MFNIFKKKKYQQRTFVFCPQCKNELVKNGKFIRDVYIKGQNIVHYICSECGKHSFWNFDHPVIFQCDTKIINKYINKYLFKKGK